ncbi:protein arginine kinase [Candidatus Methylacidithermus pantelleriae]|uniref:protein arginine kinase n=1 Tax=Candidatus Methylacidithermus pantelleriae TaxID=2744239 RepID=UPI001F0160DA|nr:protein arginine kinase [Candidatus Methylacidithermus pantelleriae]
MARAFLSGFLATGVELCIIDRESLQKAVKLQELFKNPSEWLRGDGGNNRVVICCRVRLARNVTGFAFPGWARKTERERLLEHVLPVVASHSEMKDPAICDTMDHFSALEKQVLVEEHLVSRELAGRNTGSGLVVNRPRSVSIMINEEDHLRLQAFKAGLQLQAAWELADRLDSDLDEKLEFAFSSHLGYLTACPTNVGTGLRASAMLHLPGLVLSDQIGQIVKAANRIGLAVRGLYGEGTEALGNLFQLSNQMTLGESEEEILGRLDKVIRQIVEHEENARQKLVQERPRYIADQVSRAYAILTHAYTLSSKEALNLLSILRLGVDLGIFPENGRQLIDECFIQTQPAHLQVIYAQRLNAEERDALRADLLRNRLAGFPPPDTTKLQAGFSFEC